MGDGLLFTANWTSASGFESRATVNRDLGVILSRLGPAAFSSENSRSPGRSCRQALPAVCFDKPPAACLHRCFGGLKW